METRRTNIPVVCFLCGLELVESNVLHLLIDTFRFLCFFIFSECLLVKRNGAGLIPNFFDTRDGLFSSKELKKRFELNLPRLTSWRSSVLLYTHPRFSNSFPNRNQYSYYPPGVPWHFQLTSC